MSHVTRINESCPTYRCVMPCAHHTWLTRDQVAKWVISCVWRSHGTHTTALQRVAVRCIVLQCVAVCCSVLQCVAVCCIVLQCVAVCCSVLQCVAVCCTWFYLVHEWVISRVWRSHVTHTNESCQTCEWVKSHVRMIRCGHRSDWETYCLATINRFRTLQYNATHCITLQHTATHIYRFRTLQRTAMHGNIRQGTVQQHTTAHNATTRCNTRQHTATHCTTNCRNTLQHTAIHRNTLQHILPQHTATHCNTLQHTFRLSDPSFGDWWLLWHLGLFCRYAGLFCEFLVIFGRYVGLILRASSNSETYRLVTNHSFMGNFQPFCRFIWHFCGNVGLFCGSVGLFCGYLALLCGYMGFFCIYIYLYICIYICIYMYIYI